MTNRFDWSIPPLTLGEQILSEANISTRRALDNLPYIKEFEELCTRLGVAQTDAVSYQIFRKLLRLRKTERLPRISLLVE